MTQEQTNLVPNVISSVAEEIDICSLSKEKIKNYEEIHVQYECEKYDITLMDLIYIGQQYNHLLKPQHDKNGAAKPAPLPGIEGRRQYTALIIECARLYKALKIPVQMKCIYIMPLKGKYTVYPGILAMRSAAQQTGEYGKNNVKFNHDESGNIISCTATVERWSHGEWIKYKATEFLEENKPKILTPTWAIRPKGMLAKVAEMQALRKAFPEVLCTYAKEEMEDE